MAAPRRATARTAVLPARARRARPRSDSLPRRPTARSSSASRCSRSRSAATPPRARRPCSPCARSRCAVATRRAAGAGPGGARPEVGQSLSRRRQRRSSGRSTPSRRAAVRYDRAFPHTLRVVVTPERPVLLLRQGDEAYLVAATRPRAARRSSIPRRSGLPRLWVAKDVHLVSASLLPRAARRAAAAAARTVARRRVPRWRASVRGGEELTLVLELGGSSSGSATPATCG